MKKIIEKIVANELALDGKDMSVAAKLAQATLNQELAAMVEAQGADALIKLIGELKQATNDKKYKGRLDACKTGAIAAVEARAALTAAGLSVIFSTPEQDVLQKIDLVASVGNKVFFCQVKSGEKVFKAFLAADQVAEYVNSELAALMAYAEREKKVGDPFLDRQAARIKKANSDWALLADAAQKAGATAVYLMLPKKADVVASDIKAALGL